MEEQIYLYDLYAGLNGSFGGFEYIGSMECTESEAVEYAYSEACSQYESYESLHGIKSWNDLKEENPNEDESYIDELYKEERDNWLSYYVIKHEDNIELDEGELYRID